MTVKEFASVLNPDEYVAVIPESNPILVRYCGSADKIGRKPRAIRWTEEQVVRVTVNHESKSTLIFIK